MSRDFKAGEEPSELMQILAETVRARREAIKMVQGELAERSGVSVTQISYIESARAKPTLSQLEKIAGVLGCSVVDLLTR